MNLLNFQVFRCVLFNFKMVRFHLRLRNVFQGFNAIDRHSRYWKIQCCHLHWSAFLEAWEMVVFTSGSQNGDWWSRDVGVGWCACLFKYRPNSSVRRIITISVDIVLSWRRQHTDWSIGGVLPFLQGTRFRAAQPLMHVRKKKKDEQKKNLQNVFLKNIQSNY
jgi:hypothetical protein